MQEIRQARFELTSGHVFGVSFVLFCVICAIAIGSFPLAASIATIFLFAGVHNFMEFRYFAARLPVRWGRSRNFYSIAIAGVVVLTALYLALYFSYGNWLWSYDTWSVLSASWNTAFILWVGMLFYLRGRQRPRSDWSWVFPIIFFLAALAWLIPQYWSLSLVYIHPLIALWFLDRQIRRTKPEWLEMYRVGLMSIPVVLVMLWFALYNKQDLPQDTRLFWRITQHAGSEILPGISSYLLVATHVFLETIHYVVWILIIPLVDRRAIPWQQNSIPFIANLNGFPKLMTAALIVSAVLVIVLWSSFAVDYTTTRDVYFAFAIAHVLAEFPFLIKML
jgi:hypothetical protein